MNTMARSRAQQKVEKADDKISDQNCDGDPLYVDAGGSGDGG
jgi:hypothetical protein